MEYEEAEVHQSSFLNPATSSYEMRAKSGAIQPFRSERADQPCHQTNSPYGLSRPDEQRMRSLACNFDRYLTLNGRNGDFNATW